MGKQVSWTREQKQQAAIQYAIEGNLSKIERDQGIPNQTLSDWKNNDPMWVETIGAIRDEKAEQHRAKYVQIVGLAQDQVIAKIGDASAAQANLIACQATDKVRLHDGLATSITSKAESKEDLLKKFAKIAQEYNRDVVSVQQPTNKDDITGK